MFCYASTLLKKSNFQVSILYSDQRQNCQKHGAIGFTCWSRKHLFNLLHCSCTVGNSKQQTKGLSYSSKTQCLYQIWQLIWFSLSVFNFIGLRVKSFEFFKIVKIFCFLYYVFFTLNYKPCRIMRGKGMKLEKDMVLAKPNCRMAIYTMEDTSMENEMVR